MHFFLYLPPHWCGSVCRPTIK